VRTRLERFSAPQQAAVETVGLYWHFVGAVWLFIFTSLYLSPQLF
jgi:cytochrome c oxidase subunit 3